MSKNYNYQNYTGNQNKQQQTPVRQREASDYSKQQNVSNNIQSKQYNQFTNFNSLPSPRQDSFMNYVSQQQKFQQDQIEDPDQQIQSNYFSQKIYQQQNQQNLRDSRSIIGNQYSSNNQQYDSSKSLKKELNSSRVSLQHDKDFNELMQGTHFSNNAPIIQSPVNSQNNNAKEAFNKNAYSIPFEHFKKKYQYNPSKDSKDIELTLQTLFDGFKEIDDNLNNLHEDFKNISENDRVKVPVIVLIGKTEAGKSTIANMLAGKKLEASVLNMSIRILVPDDSKSKVGHGFVSCTKVPVVLKDQDGNIIVDSPGSEDTDTKQEIINSIYMEHITSKFKNMGLVLVVSYQDFGARAKPFIDTLKYLTKVMPNMKNFQDSLFLLVNKFDHRFDEQALFQTLAELKKQDQAQDKEIQDLFKIFLSNRVACFKAPTQTQGVLDPFDLGSTSVRAAIGNLNTKVADKFKLVLSKEASDRLHNILDNSVKILNFELSNLGKLVIDMNCNTRTVEETLNSLYVWELISDVASKFDSDRMKKVNLLSKSVSFLNKGVPDTLPLFQKIAQYLKLNTFLVDRYREYNLKKYDNKEALKEIGEIIHIKSKSILVDHLELLYSSCVQALNGFLNNIQGFKLPRNSVDSMKLFLDNINALNQAMRECDLDSMAACLQNSGKNGVTDIVNSIKSLSHINFKMTFKKEKEKEADSINFNNLYQMHLGKDIMSLINESIVSKYKSTFLPEYQSVIDSINLRMQIKNSDIPSIIHIINNYVPFISDKTKSLEQKAFGLSAIASVMSNNQVIDFSGCNGKVSKVAILEEVKKALLELSGINEVTYKKVIDGGNIVHKPSKLIFLKAHKYKDNLKDISLQIANIYKNDSQFLKASEHYKLAGYYTEARECYNTFLGSCNNSNIDFYKTRVLLGNLEISEQRFDNASSLYSYVKCELKKALGGKINVKADINTLSKLLSEVYTKISLCILKGSISKTNKTLNEKVKSKIEKALNLDHGNKEADVLLQSIKVGQDSDLFKIYSDDQMIYS